MNANQAFCLAIAVLLLQIINIQLQQMFAFFILYQRWANEYREMLNIAILRRRRRCRRVRNRPYTWTIPRPAESWFDIHYNDPTIPQEYFRQQLRVNRNTYKFPAMKVEDGLAMGQIDSSWQLRKRLPFFSSIFSKSASPTHALRRLWSLVDFSNFFWTGEKPVALGNVTWWQIFNLKQTQIWPKFYKCDPALTDIEKWDSVNSLFLSLHFLKRPTLREVLKPQIS